MVELSILPRPTQEGRARQILRGEYIPYVMYAHGKENVVGVVKKEEISELLRTIRPGFLSTTKLILKDSAGKKTVVIVKEIQYKPTTYDVMHIDFLELVPGRKVNVKVPVEFLNQVDCVGVKMGGFLRQVMRHVPVRALPEQIPSHFELDMTNLDVGHVRKVKDLRVPAGVQPLVNEKEIVVSIVKR